MRSLMCCGGSVRSAAGGSSRTARRRDPLPRRAADREEPARRHDAGRSAAAGADPIRRRGAGARADAGRVPRRASSSISRATSATACARCAAIRASLRWPCCRWRSASAPTRRSSAWLTPCSSASPRSPTPRRSSTSTKPKRGRGFNPMSHPNIEDLRKGTTHVFRGIAASTFAVAPIDRGGTVATVMGEAVTGGAFALLGIEPAARQGHSARGRCRAGRPSGGDAQPRLLAARLRRRPAGGRTHAADGTRAATRSSASPRPTIAAAFRRSRRPSTSRWPWRTS